MTRIVALAVTAVIWSGCANDPAPQMPTLGVTSRIVSSFDWSEPLVTNHILRPDSTDVVVAVHRRHLTFLDTLGRVIGRFGREGAGPGEFLGQLVVGTRADSVWTADPQLARGMVVAPADGGYRSNELLFDRGGPRNDALRWGLLKGMPAPGVYLASATALSNDGASFRSVVLATGSHPDSLLTILFADPPPSDCIVPNAGRPVMFLSCFRTMHLIAPNGRSATAVRRARDLPDGVALQIVRMSFTGDTLVSSIINLPAREMTAALLDSSLAQLAKLVNHPITARGFTPPRRIPPVRYGYQGDDGTLWLAGYQMSGGLQWYLVTPDGTIAGQFVLDPELTLGAVSRDGAWAVRDLENGDAELVRITIHPFP